MSKAEIWKTLRGVDVQKQVQKKGNLDYIGWAFVHQVMMDNYPEYEVHYAENRDDVTGTCEVVATVQIGEVSQPCILPVMDHKNKPIVNPDRFAVNSARQRAYVKACALLGLGLSLYGAELGIGPENESQGLAEAIRGHIGDINAIKEGLIESPDTESGFMDLESAAQIWFELPEDSKRALWVSTKAGGPWTTQERAIIKSSQFRQAYYGIEEEA